jgi:MinD superfamily P-loop ATPase
MKVAVASGKGGTGKTMVTASLAVSWKSSVTAVDLDVEEPNLHLFLQPQMSGSSKAHMDVPVVDEKVCTFCRECAELCQFKAISVLNSIVLVFQEMCHGCGGCLAVCPEGAISLGSRVLGDISWGQSGRIGFLMGKLRIGEAMSPPLMRQVLDCLQQLKFINPSADVLIDAPPGVSCPAISAVIESDVIVLVTEPTPFGVFDLSLAYSAFKALKKPMGVVINRAGIGDEKVYQFCQEASLPVWAEIPYKRCIAEAYANGKIIAESSAKMRRLFNELSEMIQHVAHQTGEVNYA